MVPWPIGECLDRGSPGAGLVPRSSRSNRRMEMWNVPRDGPGAADMMNGVR
jgi:hypothetical protein